MKFNLRTVFCALVLVAAMSMAQAAFAQITISVSSTPTSRAITTGHVENIGTITLTVLNDPPPTTATGTITVDVFNGGVTITTDEISGTQNGDCVEVRGVGSAAVIAVFPTVVCDNAANVTVSQQSGAVVLTIPVGTDLAPGDQIVIEGIKVTLDQKGKTNTTLRAQISASPGSGINITAGEDTPTVISNILEGLLDCSSDLVQGCVALAATSTTGNAQVSAANSGAVTLFTNGLNSRPSFTLDITEAFFDAFKDLANQGGGYRQDTGLELTFNNMPAGVTINLAAGVVGPGFAPNSCGLVENNTCIASTLVISNPAITAPGTGGAANNHRTTIFFPPGPGNPAPDVQQFLTTVRLLGTVTVTGAVPIAVGTVTVQASMGQTGSAYGLNLSTVTPTAATFPRYQRTLRPTAGVPVLNVILAQTYLLVPLSQRIVAAGPGSTWDTGISVANTTADNAVVIFGSTINAGVAQSGAIRFDFFPTAGTACDYTTAASSPGTGLSSGTLGSGRTYIVLLSELLNASAASAAATNHVPCAASLGTSLFQGYIIISASFTNGHGQAFITNTFSGGTFTSAADSLVIPPPLGTANGRNANIGESLGK